MAQLDSVKSFDVAVKAATKTFKIEFTRELKKFAEELFDKYEGLESFGWTQYTPYFMDGDPCVFSIGHSEMNGSYCEGNWYEGEEFDDHKAAGKEIDKFVTSLGKCESALQSIFGDHSLVTILRSGNVQITDYDHD